MMKRKLQGAMQQLDERLKGQYASLSPQEQRVADFIFDHFDDLMLTAPSWRS